jgi:hypothetical protein
MTDVPSFFVPHFEPDKQESAYAELALSFKAALPATDKRIYSIAFRHDGEDWLATVGQQLKGMRIDTVRRRGKTVERRHRLSDSATVVAIFAGGPFLVVTNHLLAGDGPNVGSKWANPIRVGNPQSITYFAGDKN